jgi:hypothetical protein
MKLFILSGPLAECLYTECRNDECRNAECLYTECRYAECRGADISPIIVCIIYFSVDDRDNSNRTKPYLIKLLRIS